MTVKNNKILFNSRNWFKFFDLIIFNSKKRVTKTVNIAVTREKFNIFEDEESSLDIQVVRCLISWGKISSNLVKSTDEAYYRLDDSLMDTMKINHLDLAEIDTRIKWQFLKSYSKFRVAYTALDFNCSGKSSNFKSIANQIWAF